MQSCSENAEDFPTDPQGTKENVASLKDDSVLRFATIDDLENLSVSDIPGNHDGFELKELTYECVDTIELRALLFDVTATLTSSSNQNKVINFSAEVGPELVSVEYYPSAEVLPSHHNFIHNFWPKVERYRNYSDGSRIGPDEFYDYGHFIACLIYPVHTHIYPAGTNGNFEIYPRWTDGNINPKRVYYEDGVFCEYQKGSVEYNLNTTVIGENGTTYSGDDFYQINPTITAWDSYLEKQSSELKGNFYHQMYIPSRLYQNDEEAEYYLNLCKDVPDVSPVTYPKDTKSLAPGWYFTEFYDRLQGYYWLFSKYELSEPRGFIEGISFEPFVNVAIQYLVIDNRIIHFEDVALKNFKSFDETIPSFNVSKTSTGYNVRAAYELNLYGERYKAIYDLEMKGVYGPSQTIDNSDYNYTKRNDQEELDNLYTRSGDSSSEMKAIIPREDGKVIVVDRHLPKSLDNLNTRRSIKRNQK